jgi:hypothetical protein
MIMNKYLALIVIISLMFSVLLGLIWATLPTDQKAEVWLLSMPN